MLAKRIIACLDVKEGRVVKGINFVQLKDAGDPAELAAAYNREGVDEVIFLDITASHERRGLIVETVAAHRAAGFYSARRGRRDSLRGRRQKHSHLRALTRFP